MPARSSAPWGDSPAWERVEVNFGTRSATIEHDPHVAASSALVEAIRGAGYSVPDDPHASLESDLAFAEAAERKQHARTRRDFVQALGLGIATVVALRLAVPPLVPIGLGAAALLTGGRQVLGVGLRALSRRAPEMNTLVALGTLSAWLAAALSPVFPEALPQGCTRSRAR